MPRKQEPTAVDVLHYFKTAQIDAARLVLQLSKAAIDERTRPAAATRAKPAAPATTPPPPTPAPATSTSAKAPRRRAPADVPLPGLPGQVPVVGG
jgi:hypothetical protein